MWEDVWEDVWEDGGDERKDIPKVNGVALHSLPPTLVRTSLTKTVPPRVDVLERGSGAGRRPIFVRHLVKPKSGLGLKRSETVTNPCLC